MNLKTGKKLAYFLCFLLLISMIPVFGQYFGRNKVQYDTFDFKVMSTEHFDVYFYPESKEMAQHAARLAERWYARLSRVFDHKFKSRQILILYSSSPHFQQTTAISGMIGETTGGVTESLKRRIILPLAPSLKESDHVIGHELVHAFQFDITSQNHSSMNSASPSVLRLPLWLVEGLAEYMSLGPKDAHTAMWMRDITIRNEIPALKELSNPQYFPYRYGHAVWAYLTAQWGDKITGNLMKSVGKVGDFQQILKKLTGKSLEKLSEDWKNSLLNKYQPLVEKTQVKHDFSQLVIQATKENPLNVSPSISPDGENVVFLSTRDLFSVDLYLADAQNGEIKKRLTRTSIDPHFQSLQFVKSSGSWSREGDRFAFGAVNKGDPVLTVFNIKTGDKDTEVKFSELGEILNPTWSPDGRFIVFSALKGGLTDLFRYDLEEGQLTQLTQDAYADLFPTWSPDGNLIAFVTDRFSTNLSELNVGHYELALYDTQTQEIQKVAGFQTAKNINPVWHPDSQSLYFISDQNGISNIYRIDIRNQQKYQITNLYTGVSGLTGSSPAISVAEGEGDLVYCFYEDGKYSLKKIDSDVLLRMEKPVYDFEKVDPSVLPPREKPEGEVAQLLSNPLYGLPKEKSYDFMDYKPKLSLDYVAPPQVAIGVDRFGTYGGGGLALFFSDILGYHNLATMVQLSTRLQDSSALVGYEYTKYRWNLGGVIQRIPYVTGGFAQGIGEVSGEPALIEQEFIFRQVNYQIQGLATYPFSQVHRFQLSAGYSFIDFSREVRTRSYSLIDGIELSKDKESLDAPDSLHFGIAEAALVYDSSFFGATSPILGQRYRIEASPAFGSVTYYNAVADYRRYFMPLRPFTLAFRFLHYGRYGPGSEDSRLYPLFIGYQSLVRGYNTNSFSAEECGSDGCHVYDRLIGSKMMVFNAELRFPLFRVLGIGEGFYGVFPIEFNAFFDSGLAWWNDDKAWFLGGDRKPVSSAGIGLRANVFGYAILGLHLVRPFNRPQKDWYFQFTFSPGF
jgi:Tol biopolymer transport system component